MNLNKLSTLILSAALTLASCADKDKIQLETATVSAGAISETVTATGTLESVTQVDVGTQVTGKITKLFADYNSVVKKGELIAEIDKTLLESEVEAANANLESALHLRIPQDKLLARPQAARQKTDKRLRL